TLLAPANSAPVLTTSPFNTAVVDRAYVYVPQASDLDGDALTFRLTTGPEGMTVDPTTGRLTWTPTSADLGTHSITLVVSDGRGGEASQSVILSVVPASDPNHAPLLVSQPSTNFNLASGPSTVTFNAIIRDMLDTHPDFEKGISGVVTGLVANQLGADAKPVW